MTNSERFLDLYFKDLFETKLEGKRLSIGNNPSNRINILSNITESPFESRELFISTVKEGYPIVWLKPDFKSQLFIVKDFLEFKYLIKTPIVILTPTPDKELFFLMKYELPESKFKIVEFDLESISKVLDKVFTVKEFQSSERSLDSLEKNLA